jgi:hypothetical protein
VRNATTGQPLANAFVILEAKSGDGMSSRGTPSAADGSFEFRSVDAGSYTLTVRVDGYEPLQTPPSPLAEEAHLEKVELALRPVTGHVLRAVNAFGAPIPSALVVISSARGERTAGVTGPDGRITLPLDANEHGVAFVLPRSGSFAMTPFAPMSESGAQELVATVPDGAASLEIRAESTEGEPIEGVGFLLRVNGMLLPPRVQELMTFHQGFPHASDAQGRVLMSRLPQGRYELWPLASRADYLAVNSPSPPPAR